MEPLGLGVIKIMHVVEKKIELTLFCLSCYVPMRRQQEKMKERNKKNQ